MVDCGQAGDKAREKIFTFYFIHNATNRITSKEMGRKETEKQVCSKKVLPLETMVERMEIKMGRKGTMVIVDKVRNRLLTGY